MAMRQAVCLAAALLLAAAVVSAQPMCIHTLVSTPLVQPFGVALDALSTLYISDQGSHFVYVLRGGALTTFAGTGVAAFSGDGGAALSAALNTPRGIAIDPATGAVFIADSGNGRIRVVQGGIIASLASANLPYAVAVHPNGFDVFFAEPRSQRIRVMRPNGTLLTTFAGSGVLGFSGNGGPATAASMYDPSGVAVDASAVFIAETGNNRVRVVQNGSIFAFAGGGSLVGDGGPAATALVTSPRGVAVDASGVVYIAGGWLRSLRAAGTGRMEAWLSMAQFRLTAHALPRAPHHVPRLLATSS